MKHFSSLSSVLRFVVLLVPVGGLLPACGSDSGSGSGASCGSIAGGYAIDEKFDGTCPSTTPITNSASVTVTGTDVKITNGTNFSNSCTLSGCDCSTKSGKVYKFTATGFTAVENDSGCTRTMTGTKK